MIRLARENLSGLVFFLHNYFIFPNIESMETKSIIIHAAPQALGLRQSLYENVSRDWFKRTLDIPVKYHFALNQHDFYFSVSRQTKAVIHPDAQPGEFQSELWKYDVAEFFIAPEDRSATEYLEFNLAPNGSWWSCFFKQPRVPAQCKPLQGVRTEALLDEEKWSVQAAIPRNQIPWLGSARCLLNAAFILDSPEQRFLTVADLGNGAPDFHRPQDFLPMRLSSSAENRHTDSDA